MGGGRGEETTGETDEEQRKEEAETRRDETGGKGVAVSHVSRRHSGLLGNSVSETYAPILICC